VRSIATKSRLRSQAALAFPYDRLVIAPGIDLKWDSVPGYSEAAAQIMPHCLETGRADRIAGQETERAQGRSLDRHGGAARIRTVARRVPMSGPRCFAHVLKKKGHKKSKIIIVDPKPTFSKQAVFLEGWEKHYPGMIEWQDPKIHGGIKGVDPKTGEVKTDFATYKAALANVIPAQMAGKIARDAGLADQSGYCPIDPESMKSKIDANIFVVGDAAIPGDMPKSAFSANSQAKVAAMIIRAELTKSRAFPARYSKHLLEPHSRPTTIIKVGASLCTGDGKIKETGGSGFRPARNTKQPIFGSRIIRNPSIGITGIVADVFG
jgi:NADPH-dependent 2,4-dienoyl-CoA reductase/sulfur reductase-like enzyme